MSYNTHEAQIGAHLLCNSLTHLPLPSPLRSLNHPATPAGDFSFAAVQANTLMEDVGVVESGPWGTNAAVFDGHAGTQASHFLGDNFFSILRSEWAIGQCDPMSTITLSMPLQGRGG